MQAKTTNTKLYINQGKWQQTQMSQNNKKKEYQAHPVIVQTGYMDS